MKIHTILVELANGEKFTRTEWGRTRRQAIRTIFGIYGAENIVSLT